MKKARRYCGIILSVVLLLTGILAVFLAYLPGKMTEEHTDEIVELYFNDMNYDSENFIKDWNSVLEADVVLADDGHEIPIFYYRPMNSYDNKTIILIHWHEANHKAMYPIAEIFLEQNFNVVLYDAPAHGSNTAKRVSFGYYEKDDLERIVTYTRSKMSNDNIIGVLGQSMGGTTVAYYSGTEHAAENLDFAIIDSAFTSMDAIIAWQIDNISPIIPTKLLIHLGNISSKLMYGYSYNEVNAVNSIKNNRIPTLILHSKADQKCPFKMGEELYKAICCNNKRLIIFENSLHLKAFWDENEKYRKAIFDFIEEEATDR